MRQQNHNLMIFVASFITTLFAFGDTGKLYTSDKISSSMTSCIIQDKYGLIWVGSEYGLNKFDGYHFTTYYTNENDITSIVNNDVGCLLVDSRKRLWIGFSRGLAKYDYAHNCFRRYQFPNGNSPRVEVIIEDADGNILIGTAGYGIYCIKAGEDKLIKENEFKRVDADEYCNKLFEDEQHNLWRTNNLSKITRIKVNNLHPTSFKDYMLTCGPAVSFLKPDHKGFYIVCMYGIIRYNYSTGLMSNAGFNLSALDNKVSIRKALIDSRGDIYIGASGKGLMMIPYGSKELRPVENRNGKFDLSTSNINDIYEDKDHNLWLSCYKKGLFQLNSGKEAFSSWSFSAQNIKTGSSIASITSGDNGDVLCTVQKNGVYKIHPNGEIIASPGPSDGPNTIYRDKQGKYWLCTENALYSYNHVLGKCHLIKTFDGWGLNCMTDNGDGTLYICNYGKGLCIYDTNKNIFKSISMNQIDKKKGHLCNDWIKTLYIDSRGLLWIGCADGLSCMNPADNSFRIFGWNTLLPGIQCFSICENNDGNMLFGTSSGLFYFDRRANRLVIFPHSDSLKGNSVYGIVIDNSGDIWTSTANGIWQYDHKRNKFISHINGNGLVTKEYIPGAMLHDIDDRIVFGINDGVTVFYPDNVRNMKLKMGAVYITKFKINGKDMNPLLNEFEIPFNENSFEMEFSLLNFNNADNVIYQYCINNSKEWISLQEGSNTLSFTKLKPGKYIFAVRAENNGIYSNGIKVITVEVKGPWFLSIWAYIFYLMIAVTAIIIGLVAYERRKKTEMDEAKMKFLIDATHDIRSPLTLIMGPLDKLKKRTNDIKSKTYIDVIEHNAQRLLLLVNQILDERKIDKNQMHLHCRNTNMVKFISSVRLLYQFNARQHNITYKFTHTDKIIMAWIDRINFEKVITNLLSNAFKYTSDNGEIEIKLTQDDANVSISILDTGTGFKDEKTERLFERFYQGCNSEEGHVGGTGIGLNLSRAIVKMHGGTITAANRNDSKIGACLIVTLPLGNKHLKPDEIVTEEEMEGDEVKVKKKASRNIRILLVDDDYDIAQYIKDELSDWFHFDITDNGKDALGALLSNNYDLVISDVMMPVMDGITLVKEMKSNTLINDIPVILLTSKTEVDDRMTGLKQGADGYLVKPFDMDELHVLIDNLVNNVRRLRGKFSGMQGQEDKIEKVEVVGDDDAMMRRIMKSINDNLSDSDFNVVKLTEDVGISRAQLHRKMKEITGISTGEFIRNLRLEQASRLIAEGKVNVTQVAYAVGFNSQPHFSTLFKKHFGLSPTEYALKNMQKNQ